jgi:hypothetical protein
MKVFLFGKYLCKQQVYVNALAPRSGGPGVQTNFRRSSLVSGVIVIVFVF